MEVEVPEVGDAVDASEASSVADDVSDDQNVRESNISAVSNETDKDRRYKFDSPPRRANSPPQSAKQSKSSR